MALDPKTVNELYDSLKELLDKWMNIKLVLVKAFGTGPLAQEHEAAYLNLKSDVSRIYRVLSTKLPTGLAFEGDKMMEMLKNAMTMENLRGRPANDKQSLYVQWHRIYILMSRTLGALEAMKEGYYPHLHRARLKSPAPAKAKKVNISPH